MGSAPGEGLHLHKPHELELSNVVSALDGFCIVRRRLVVPLHQCHEATRNDQYLPPLRQKGAVRLQLDAGRGGQVRLSHQLKVVFVLYP